MRLFDLARRVPMFVGPVTRLLTRMAGSSAMERHARSTAAVRWSHEAFPSPRNIRFNEMEYALPADAGVAALRDVVTRIRHERIDTVFPIEARWVGADDVWLSPFQGRASMTIAVHQYVKQDHEKFFSRIEPIFRAHGGRPHWGKHHRLKAADLAPLYPHWEDFQAVRRRLDPKGRMLNAHLRDLFGA
jgi:FAD/FMN-containing dehydrogenase